MSTEDFENYVNSHVFTGKYCFSEHNWSKWHTILISNYTKDNIVYFVWAQRKYCTDCGEIDEKKINFIAV